MGKPLGKPLGNFLPHFAPNCATSHFTKFLANRANPPYLPTFSAIPQIVTVELEGTERRIGNCGVHWVSQLRLTYI